MLIRKLRENDAKALWKLRMYALETDPISFGDRRRSFERLLLMSMLCGSTQGTHRILSLAHSIGKSW